MASCWLLLLAPLFIAACDSSPVLPGGYTVNYGDRGKAWLQNPDGTIAHPGLIKRLYHDQKNVLLVALPVSYGNEAVPPFPLDDSCYVALVFDGPTNQVRQIRLAEADRLAARMTEVEAYERPC